MILDRCPNTPRPERFDPCCTLGDESLLCPPAPEEMGKLAGYLRTGGCTVGCGACCEALLLPLAWSEAMLIPHLWLNALGIDRWQPINFARFTVPVRLPMASKDEEGRADWENWLALHNVYLSEFEGGVVLAHVPLLHQAVTPSSTRGERWLAWFEKQGMAIIWRGAQYALHVPLRCTMLAADGLCRLHNSLLRPSLCDRYPRHPRDIEGFESFCTYNFHPLRHVHRLVNAGRDVSNG